jgi:hypothetical protein
MARHLEGTSTLLAEQVERLREVVRGLSDRDLIEASGCRGWRVADLVVHLRRGAESILLGLASPTEDPPDRDVVSYWREWPARGEPTFADVRFTWANSAAYGSGDGLRQHFDDMAAGVALGVVAPLAGNRRFQGHVLHVEDFVATWVVEFALHHFDLTAHLADRPGPCEGAVELAAATLDGLIGLPRPAWWDVTAYVFKATGREALTEEDKLQLGGKAAVYPVIG